MEELRPQAPKSRCLRRVVERVPKPIYSTHTFGATMTSILIIETLECGHKLTIFWQADLLIARWRTCPECAKAASLPEKKPAKPARIPHWRKAA